MLRLRAFLAAVRSQPVATGVTAALVHGFAVHDADLRTCLVVHRDGQHPYFAGGVRHREAELADDEVTRVDGILVTTPARTVVDVARHHSFASAVVTADSALRAGLSRDDLWAAATRARSWSGGRTATRVAGFADGRAQSPGESLTRVLMSEAGLPTPEPQFGVRDRYGLIGLVDLALVAWRVIVEFDGRSKYGIDGQDAREQLWAEKQREDRLRAAGWEVVRVIWAQLRNPELMLRILEARERAIGRVSRGPAEVASAGRSGSLRRSQSRSEGAAAPLGAPPYR